MMMTNRSIDLLIWLESGGKAPILSFNLPEPSIYLGRNFIELDYEEDFFTEKAKAKPLEEIRPTPPSISLGRVNYDALVSEVRSTMRTGFADPRLFPFRKNLEDCYV
jgi:hypothetical protein